MSSPRALVDRQNMEGANGGGEIALTYQCTRLKNGRPEIYFDTEKVPYKTKGRGRGPAGTLSASAEALNGISETQNTIIFTETTSAPSRASDFWPTPRPRHFHD